MTELVTGTILFRCTQGTSNKDYELEVYRETDDPTDTEKMRCRHGPAGKLGSKKTEYGTFSIEAASKHLTKKTNKGYNILTVNEKPFLSGDLQDALKVVHGGNGWNATSTAQPERKIRAVEVTVTYDVGAYGPAW
jgi:hypothetical protein